MFIPAACEAARYGTLPKLLGVRDMVRSGLACIAVATVLSVTDVKADGMSRGPYAGSCCTSSWTGLYVGGGFGYGFFDLNNVNKEDRVNPSLPSQDTGGRGWLGTVLLGFDVQAGNAVLGAFVDYDWNRSTGEWRDRAGGENLSGDIQQRSALAVGGRLGFLANPGTLLYSTVGWTRADFDSVNFVPFGTTTVTRSIPSQSFDGWFVGGGVETKLWHSGVSMRLEYRYSDFGDKDIDRVVVPGGGFNTQVSEHLTEQTIRTVWTYKFNRDDLPLK